MPDTAERYNFRYYEYSEDTRLIGCVGRYDIVLNYGNEVTGRIIADYGPHDAAFFVLVPKDEHVFRLRNEDGRAITRSRLSDYPHAPSADELATMKALIQLYCPERNVT